MSNCLITKLTTSVDDDSLEKLGCIRLDVDNASSGYFKITPTVIHSTSGAVTMSKDDNLGYIVSGTGSIWVEKYDIEEIITTSNDFTNTVINLDQLKYCNKLTKIGNNSGLFNINFTGDVASLEGKKMTVLSLSVETTYYISSSYGDLSVLKDMPLITLNIRNQRELYGDLSDIISDTNKLTITIFNIFQNTNITGDVNLLSECINITSLILYDGKLTGNLDDLFTTWSTAGKTSTCNIIIGGTYLVSSITKDYVSHTISFDGVGGWSEIE